MGPGRSHSRKVALDPLDGGLQQVGHFVHRELVGIAHQHVCGIVEGTYQRKRCYPLWVETSEVDRRNTSKARRHQMHWPPWRNEIDHIFEDACDTSRSAVRYRLGQPVAWRMRHAETHRLGQRGCDLVAPSRRCQPDSGQQQHRNTRAGHKQLDTLAVWRLDQEMLEFSPGYGIERMRRCRCSQRSLLKQVPWTVDRPARALRLDIVQAGALQQL